MDDEVSRLRERIERYKAILRTIFDERATRELERLIAEGEVALGEIENARLASPGSST